MAVLTSFMLALTLRYCVKKTIMQSVEALDEDEWYKPEHSMSTVGNDGMY